VWTCDALFELAIRDMHIIMAKTRDQFRKKIHEHGTIFNLA
jgi:hypothetical protein